MLAVFEATVGDPARTRVVRVTAAHELKEGLAALGLGATRPVLVLVGGGDSIDATAAAQLRPLFVEGLAPAAEHLGAALVDGGTDAGVMRLIGEARSQIGGLFPLLGVAAAGTVRLPDDVPRPPGEAAALAPHHSHALLVPGHRWGEESPWLADAATVLAGERASLTVLIGGGAIAWEDVENSVAARRSVLVVAGSGGTADVLAACLTGRQDHPRAARLISTGLLQLSDGAAGPAALRRTIEAALTAEPATARATAAPTPAEAATGALRELLAALPLPLTKQRFLELRWLDQVDWLERKAGECQRRYYWSRRLIIVCSALLPGLIGGGQLVEATGGLRYALTGLGFVASLVVTIAAAWEEFFRYGERWRHYRSIAEQLKSEGWLYVELGGPYAAYPSHARAHGAFVLRVEQLLAQDTQRFLGEVTAERSERSPARGSGGPRPAGGAPP